MQQTGSHCLEKGSSVVLGDGSAGVVKNDHGTSRYSSMKMHNDGVKDDTKKATKVTPLKAVPGTNSLQNSEPANRLIK